MDEKYYITLYKKLITEEKFIVFKREKVINNANINYDDEDEDATYYDKNGKRIVVQSMYNNDAILDDEKYVYGFAVEEQDLKDDYPKIKNNSNLLKKYKEEISSVLVFGYNDLDNDRIKLLVTNEEILKKIENEDELFDMFILLQNNEENEIALPISDLNIIEEMIKAGKIKELEEKINQLKNDIDETDDDVNEYKNKSALDEKMKEIAKKEEIIDPAKKKENLNKSIKKLNDLVGLDNVKEEISKLLYYTLFKDKVKDKINLDNPKLSMFFSGNPGTGKTTVARLVGDILYNMGYLSSNKFIEITPKDLIAEYVGQTAVKTSTLLKKNEGGVIFIDEAYVLSSSGQEFAQEAIVEILKELEKNNTVFIFAGYEKEMAAFMNSNPGLTSRIGYNLDFKDYDVNQLHEMFINKITCKGFTVSDELNVKVDELITNAMTDKHFGNGRYIDKIIDKIIEEHAKNTFKCNSDKELLTLTNNDVNESINNTLLRKQLKKKIGF